MTWRETIAKAGAYLQAKAVPDAQVAAVQTGSSMYCVKGSGGDRPRETLIFQAICGFSPIASMGKGSEGR